MSMSVDQYQSKVFKGHSRVINRPITTNAYSTPLAHYPDYFYNVLENCTSPKRSIFLWEGPAWNHGTLTGYLF